MNFARVISILEMAEQLRITLNQIEYSFDTCRHKTATQALLDYRLNRLCDQMSEHPSEEIGEQMKRCGLLNFLETSLAFETCFGIDIIEYHLQCFGAAASKRIMRDHEECPEEALIADSTFRILGEI